MIETDEVIEKEKIKAIQRHLDKDKIKKQKDDNNENENKGTRTNRIELEEDRNTDQDIMSLNFIRGQLWHAETPCE